MQAYVNEAHIDPDWVQQYLNYLPQAIGIWKNYGLEYAATHYGVESSTIRAIRTGKKGVPHGPLHVFNTWAEKQHAPLQLGPCWKHIPKAQRAQQRQALNAQYWSSLSPEALQQKDEVWQQLQDFVTFERWYQALVDDLCSDWQTAVQHMHASKAEAYALSVAHRHKLADLFVRWMRVRSVPDSAMFHTLTQRAHVPLDKKSLALLGEAFQGHAPVYKHKGRDYSMGDIKDAQMYATYQAMARTFIEVANRQLAADDPQLAYSTPIMFDVFVWNCPQAQAVYA